MMLTSAYSQFFTAGVWLPPSITLPQPISTPRWQPKTNPIFTPSISTSSARASDATAPFPLSISSSARPLAPFNCGYRRMDKPVGPTVPTAWGLHPAPKPIPDFDAVLAHRPDEHWLTLLGNRGAYDARRSFAQMEQWAEKHPGVPAELTNSLKDAMGAAVFNNTVTLDIEFKRRLPKEGVKWTFTRAATRMLDGGRMDLDLTICDEKMEILCLARQVILALDAKKKFGGKGAKSAL